MLKSYLVGARGPELLVPARSESAPSDLSRDARRPSGIRSLFDIARDALRALRALLGSFC